MANISDLHTLLLVMERDWQRWYVGRMWRAARDNHVNVAIACHVFFNRAQIISQPLVVTRERHNHQVIRHLPTILTYSTTLARSFGDQLRLSCSGIRSSMGYALSTASSRTSKSTDAFPIVGRCIHGRHA